jgi:cob(I)alamin adenosyltransferase
MRKGVNMSKFVQIYCGSGKGKTSAALGRGIQYACLGKSVFIISFLKVKSNLDMDFLKRLEPEIKVFSFDKFSQGYDQLNETERKEARIHVQNGINFARKVLMTEECDVLILDEVLDLEKHGMVGSDDILHLLQVVPDGMEVILTGDERCERLWPCVDMVTDVETLKESAKASID